MASHRGYNRLLFFEDQRGSWFKGILFCCEHLLNAEYLLALCKLLWEEEAVSKLVAKLEIQYVESKRDAQIGKWL